MPAVAPDPTQQDAHPVVAPNPNNREAPGLTLGYLSLYAALGYGARDSGTYISPFSDPLGYAAAAVARIPVLLGEAFGAFPSELWGVEVRLRQFMMGWGVLLTVIVLGVIRWRRPTGARWRRELWLLASTAVALVPVPVVGGFLGGRLLVVASVGARSLLGIALVRALLLAGDPKRRRWLARLAFAFLLVLHFGLAPLARALDFDACGDRELLYALTGSDPSNSMYLGASLMFFTPARVAHVERVRALSMVPSDHRLTRVDERTFSLEVVGARDRAAMESVHRLEPLETGHVARVAELTVTVTDATPTGGARRASSSTVPSNVCASAGGKERRCASSRRPPSANRSSCHTTGG